MHLLLDITEQFPRPTLNCHELTRARGVWYNLDMNNLQAIIHKCRAPETGYWAEVPSIPGCVTQGETLEEVQAMIQDAVSAWFASAWDIAMAGRKKPISKGDRLVPVFA